MSPAQLSYPEDQDIGIPGQLADSGPKDVISRLAEDSQIRFGRIVVLGTDKDTQAKLPALSGDITDPKKVLGATLHSHARESLKDEAQTAYKQGESVSILKDGRILMEVEQAMTPESDIYVRFAGKKQVQTILWDADFITGNVVDGKVNGTAIASVPFNTDQATTLSDVANAIVAANSDVESASVTGAREITVTSIIDKTVTLSDFVVTGGASQASETVTETVAGVLTADRGKIRADDDGSTAAQLSNAKIRKSASGAGEIAVLEIDL